MLERPPIDNDFARTWLDPDPRDRVLALAGGIGAPLLIELLNIAGSSLGAGAAAPFKS